MPTPSVIDIARHCGVSPSTVCRALNQRGDISPKTRKKILEACETLGYVKNLGASNLRLRTSSVIASLMPDHTNELFIEKISFIKQAAVRSGHRWRLYSYQDMAEAKSLLREILSSRPAGVVLGCQLGDEDYGVLQNCGVPCVCYDCDADGVDAVLLDREAGAYAAVSYLLGLGRTRIVMLGFGPESDRGQGYSKAMRERGIHPIPELVLDTPFGRDLFQYGYAQALAAADSLTFDGILAVNDASAIGAMRALHERGMRVPEDVAVIGFDNIMVAPFTSPALSTISQPKEELADQCVGLLLQRIETPSRPPSKVRLDTQLCLRESA